MNKPIIHSGRGCRGEEKHRTVEVIDFRYECAAVPVGRIENIYFAGCRVNKSESRDLFPDIG